MSHSGQSAPSTSKPAAGTPRATSRSDLFPLELVHLLGTARHVIDQHVNDCGDCSHCGLIWPCRSARLAEFALATL